MFDIKKSSGGWRLIQDLRAINKTASLGLPSKGAALHPGHPDNVLLLAIDIKDWFFPIPLYPRDLECFAFSVPPLTTLVLPHDMSGLSSRREWLTVKPSGQEAVATALNPYLDKGLTTYHYKDDILIWGDSSTHTPTQRSAYTFTICPRIQNSPPPISTRCSSEF